MNFSPDSPASRKGRAAKLIGHVKAQLLETGVKRRTEYMTAPQCRLLRAKAHEHGRSSVAPAQAFAFELGVRQKDVIGEGVPGLACRRDGLVRRLAGAVADGTLPQTAIHASIFCNHILKKHPGTPRPVLSIPSRLASVALRGTSGFPQV